MLPDIFDGCFIGNLVARIWKIDESLWREGRFLRFDFVFLGPSLFSVDARPRCVK